MSNRERWVVYPLLLFTFLMATRDDYVKPAHFDCDSISCRRLVVSSIEGKAIISMGPSEDEAGALRIYGSRHPIRLPGAEVAGDQRRQPGHEIFEVGANEDGGYLRVFGSRPGHDLQLGHDGVLRQSGLTAISVKDEYVPAPAGPPEPVIWGNVLAWLPPEATEDAEAADATENKSEVGGEARDGQ
jgi:hypothetical protein